ncbi:hypothetical protein [Nocardia tengchongensis]|uniref:hypothetical protein n=1 Tax=Nocardia tengchongensis TaxID=2055889 RepID=UPI003695E2BA
MLEPRQGGFRRARRRTAEAADGLPTRAAARNAKITALPVAYAARRVGGLGRRALGTPAREVELDIQARTAQHMFEVLGELKGVAAKLGQLLALYELALPPELGEPYREALTRLQDSIPAMLPAAVGGGAGGGARAPRGGGVGAEIHTTTPRHAPPSWGNLIGTRTPGGSIRVRRCAPRRSTPRWRRRWAPGGGIGSPSSTLAPRRPPRWGRCIARCGRTVGGWR